MVTTQTADNALKSYYLSAVADQLNKNINPLLAQIKQTTADVWGRDVRKSVRFGINGGIGAGTETGILPGSSSNHYAQFVTTLKNLYGTIEVSDKAIRASQSNEGAFVNILNDEMQGLIDSASFNFGRMLFGDGSGVLCKVTSISGGFYHVDNTRFLVEGMVVDLYNDDSLATTERVIESIDRENSKVKLSGQLLNMPSGMTLLMCVRGSKDLEITGLKAIFDSSTLYGVDKSTNTWMKPYNVSSVGALTENALQKAIDTVEERSGGKINFIVTSPGVRRAFAATLSARRYVETMELEGGYKAISFNGIPIVADRFCQSGTMYLLNTEDFCLHQLCDWQWLEGDNGAILKQNASKPVFSATLVKYAELMCYRPCGQARLTGITES